MLPIKTNDYILIVLCLLTALSTVIHPAYAKSPPPGAGAADIPANILLALDTSGSMSAVVGSTSDFSYPYDVTTDHRGYTYVAELYDGITVYNSDGILERTIGRFSSSDAQPDNFYYIYGVATDSHNNVYVCDRYHERVQMFDQYGAFLRSFQLSTECTGIEISPTDEIYVIRDDGNVSIYKPDGTFVTIWYKSQVIAVAFDSEGRHVVLRYISGQYRLHFYNADRTYVNFFFLNSSHIGYDLHYPRFVAVDDDDHIYVTDSDYYKSAVYKLHKRSDRGYINSSNDIAYTTYRGGYRSSSAGFYRSPYGLHYDKHRDDVMVADFHNDRIQIFNAGSVTHSGRGETRLEQMVKVIKQIVSDSALTDGANFGLLEWNTDAEITIPIGQNGAADIYDRVDELTANGGTYLHKAMTTALPYFTGNKPDSPQPKRYPCQKNIIIVISDGYWVENGAEEVTRNLSENHDVLTYVIGFQTTGDSNYITLSQAGGTYPDSPLFADNWQELYENLSGVIRNATNVDLTFAAPTIMPDVVGDDHILQATFRYKSDHQWKGRLKKFSLDANGNVSGQVWDAGERMNLISADHRNIWTVSDYLPQHLNNFNTNHVDLLRPMMEAHRNQPFDTEDLTDLISFVRGKDIYHEFPEGYDDDGDTLYPGDRWKLADIYRSRALAVGAPTARIAPEAHPNSDAFYRAEKKYAAFQQSDTCGTTCASRKHVIYAGSNGGLLHAFDADTGDELWGFIPPMILPTFKDMISVTPGTSSAIFAVDGSPVVKDVFDGKQWRTILAIGLRQGGGGYSLLDVTHPYAPKHIYSIGYDNITDEIRYWNAFGTQATFKRRDNVPPGFNVRRLGETWGDPQIMRLPLGRNKTDTWVLVAGGGYNNRVSRKYGDMLYFFDIFGEEPVLKSLRLADQDNGDGIRNALPASISAITADSTARFTHRGALLYITDQEGILHKINATSTGNLYAREKILDIASTSRNGRIHFSQNISAFADGHLYHVGGTGDITDLDNIGNSIDNRIFAVRDRHFPGIQPQEHPLIFSDLSDKTDQFASCTLAEEQGWQVQLPQTKKVLSEATVFNYSVLAPVYTPAEEATICNGGTSSLLEIRFKCGTEMRETQLGYGISTRAVVYNNKVYLGISDSSSSTPLAEGFTKTGNLIVGTPVNIRSPSITVESWWEIN